MKEILIKANAMVPECLVVLKRPLNKCHTENNLTCVGQIIVFPVQLRFACIERVIFGSPTDSWNCYYSPSLENSCRKCKSRLAHQLHSVLIKGMITYDCSIPVSQPTHMQNQRWCYANK